MRVDFINKADGKDKDYYLMVIDDKGYIQFANSHFISNLEIKPEKIQENSFFNFLGPKHLKIFKDTISHVQKTNTPVCIDISARNGSLHWMKLEISKYKNGADGSNKYFCIGYDIVGKERIKKMKNVASRNYDAIMDGLTIGVIMQDINGDVLAANQKAAEIFNIGIETLYENNGFKNLWNCIFDESGQVSYEKSPPVKALQTRELQKDIRLTFKTGKAELRTLLINSQPLFGENDSELSSVITSITDISKESDLEIEIHQQDIMFQAFHNNSPNLAWVVDEDARLYFMNKVFLSFLQLKDNIIGKDILKLLPKDIAGFMEKVHRQVLETGVGYKSKEKYILIDGSELIFWISIFPIELKNGKRLLGGEAIDVTKQLMAQEQLQHANDRLSYFSSVTKDAIWEWDMRSGQIYRNQKLFDLIGYSVKSSYSLGWWFKRIHPDDRIKVRDTVKQVVDKKMQSWEREYRFKKATGHCGKGILYFTTY